MNDSATFAQQIARQVFAKRGNHSEAHLTEIELAAIIALAIDLYTQKGPAQ